MDGIRLTGELRADGFGYGEISHLARTGELRHLRRGAYAPPIDGSQAPRAAHLELLEATLRQCSEEAVASHMSAAAVYGLPLWTHLLDRVHLTRDRAGGLRQRRYSLTRGRSLLDDEVAVVDGFRVTSLARTLVDLGCLLPMRQSVAVGDAAVRRGLTPSQIEVALDRARRRHGIVRARRALRFLDGRSESPGESVSRVVFLETGIPAPELQVEIRSPAGSLIGRCDFGWEDRRTIGEFDGKIKYGRSLQPGTAVEDIVFAEKRREDALRDHDLQVVRWIWPDLLAPAELHRRLLQAFARGRRTA